LCVQPGRFEVARVSRNADGKPKLELFETFDRGQDELDGLKRLRKALALQKARCTTLLQPSEYQLLQLETPVAASPDERMEALRARVQEMIETPIVHVTFDAFDIPTETLAPGRPRNSYAVVAGNAGVAPKVQSFHRAGIGLKAIDIPEMAQRNIAALCEEQPNRALGFLAFDESGGLLTFSANGELYMFRRIDITLTALLTDDMDRRSTLFDRVGLELQRSLDNFDRQYGGFLPLSRLVIGPQPEATPLQGYLKDYLGIKVDTVDLADLIDISAIPELRDPGRQAQGLQAIGAALREEAAA
jgi:MSHA biogenesis protein MshI